MGIDCRTMKFTTLTHLAHRPPALDSYGMCYNLNKSSM